MSQFGLLALPPHPPLPSVSQLIHDIYMCNVTFILCIILSLCLSSIQLHHLLDLFVYLLLDRSGDMSGARGLDIGEPSELPINSDKEVPDSGEISFSPITSTTLTTSSFITPTTSMSTSSITVTEQHALSLRLKIN